MPGPLLCDQRTQREMEAMSFTQGKTRKQWRDDDAAAPLTPWGAAQLEYTIAPGILLYTTAGHGGFRISPQLQAKMPEHDRAEWFEEDCEWCRVVLAFPEHFDSRSRADARGTYDQWEMASKPPFCRGMKPTRR